MDQKKKYSPFDHATHNLKAHELLKKSEIKFSDWEVTTAFYASLKFIEGSLFPDTFKHPKEDEQRHYESYNDYKGEYNRFVGGTPHSCMKYFVNQNTPANIQTFYSEIYDVCHNARYKNYQVKEGDLKIAKDALESIRIYCVENQK